MFLTFGAEIIRLMKFAGLGVALVTPFNEDGSVDYNGLEKLVNHNIENGTDTLVVQGTTAEAATLNNEEKQKVLSKVIEVNKGRKEIVLGIGGNNTLEVGELLKTTDFTGVDGVLSVSPFYNKPTQEGIYQHYKYISACTDLPIILYNVPGRTSSNVLAETTLRIARDCKNVVAVKEASGSLEQVMKIIQDRPEGFTVLSGDDALTLPMTAAGGDGVISVVGNAFPKEFSEMVKLTKEGKLNEARDLHYKVLDLIHALFIEGNPGGIKEVLKQKGICGETLRLPLVNVSNETKTLLKDLIAKNNL